MHDHKKTFETDSIGRLLFKMSLPAMVGMMVNALYNLVDTIFVGQGVGSHGIGGLTIAFPIQALIGALGLTFGTGAASIISRRLGEKNPEAAARTAVTAFYPGFPVQHCDFSGRRNLHRSSSENLWSHRDPSSLCQDLYEDYPDRILLSFGSHGGE